MAIARPRVLVVGGGPAGSTSAAILAERGADVVLLESQRHPRHHVGESLQPAAFDYLEKFLGLGGAFDHCGFGRKYGAVYVWGESRDPWRVLFDARLDAVVDDMTEDELLSSDMEHAYNVDRSVFDAILIDRARQAGVDVREETKATQVLFDGDRVSGVTAQSAHSTEDIHADVVLDCTGQRCLVGRTTKTTHIVQDLRCTATYGYYENAGGIPGALGRHVQYVVTIPEGWVWFIPTSAGTTSVGVVVRERAKVGRKRFLELVAQAELPLQNAKLIGGEDGLYFARDWSFHHKQMAGNGYYLVGDAACFVDPILSGGVDFAIRGGCKVADAVTRQFGDPNADLAAIHADYTARVDHEYRAYLKLARYWYGNNRSVDGFFWSAASDIDPHGLKTPLRAFVYLTSGKYARDNDFKVFAPDQEREMFRRLGVDTNELRKAQARRAMSR